MNVLIQALKKLLASEKALSVSNFSVNQRKQLEHFAQSTRLLEISKQGRSTIYRVLNHQAVRHYLDSQQPLADNELNPELPARSLNIARDRHSKKGQANHDYWYLLMKAWDVEVVWQREQACLPVAELTRAFGVAALRIHSGEAWSCNRPLLLVENQALFDCCDWLPEGFNGCVAYYAGQVSDVLLQWLVEYKRTDTIILFPDYDGVGLANYARLADVLPSYTQLQFFWIPDWESKLAQFGNSTVWQNTRVVFENAVQKLVAMNALTTELSRLADLSHYHGKALEQESIWL